MAVQKGETPMNTLSDNVSISLRQAWPAAARLALIGGLLSLALAAAGCGGGGSGTAGGGTSSGSSSGSGTGTGGSGATGSSGGTGGGSGGSSGGTGSGSGSGQNAATPVVYIADQDVYERYELYLADPAAPGGSIKLNGALPTDGDVEEFTITKSGTAVVYSAEGNTPGRTELYVVNLANPGAATRINTPLTFNRDVLDFAVSPDGTKVVYRADQDVDNVFELYLINTATPGVSVKLSADLVTDGWVRSGFTFSPDGLRVVYRADQEVADRVELYLVEVATPGVAKKVNPVLVSGGNVYSAFSFSPDSATVAYVADQETDDTLELFAAAVTTPGVTDKLNGPLTANGDVCRFEFSPDSTRVAYCADQDTDEVLELYTVALNAPGQSVKVNPPLVAGGKVTSGYDFSPDSSFIVYAAEQDVAGRIDLYRVDVAAPGIASKLNAPLTMGGNVVGFHLTPDGKAVGYTANQEDVGVYEIYQADFMAPGAATKLSAPMAFNGVYSFRYSADGAEVIYVAAQSSAAAEIFRVDLAVPGTSAKVSGTLVAGGEVWDYGLVQ
jgi:Tol biopolymer transport system component